MVSRLHLSDKNFNKKNIYYVNKEDDTKHLIDIDDQILNTEEQYAEQLARLISCLDSFKKTPKEFAETVRFLCGPNSRYTTGQTLHVNGGWYVSIN